MISYDEIGQRLKAYRLGSGLTAEELAHKLGISRAALFRFERGGLAKIETLEKLAELLEVSVPTLLGVGIEYIPSPIAYFERVRQIEEQSDHMSIFSGPVSALLASDDFENALEEVLTENVPNLEKQVPRARADTERVIEIIKERRQLYRRRQPLIVNLMTVFEVERFLDHGLIGTKNLPKRILQRRRELARAEIEHFIQLLENPPIGVQIGLVPDTAPQIAFRILRQPNHRLLLMSPFRIGGEPNVTTGVGMITTAPDGVSLHENAFRTLWNRAHKGPAAASLLRQLVASQCKT